MAVAVVATALLAGGCAKRPFPGAEFTAIESGFPKWLGEETKLHWSGSGGQTGDRESTVCSFDFDVTDAVPTPSGGLDRDTQREKWVRAQVDRGALLAALRDRAVSALQSNGCRTTASGEHGNGKSLQSFTIGFESGQCVGGVQVAAYETTSHGVTVHLYIWEAAQ